MTDDLDPLIAEAQGYLDKGLWTFARRSLETLYAHGHRPAFIARQLGDVCAAEGRPDDAIRWHRQAIELEPRSYRSYENLIFTLDAQADTTEAEATEARRAWWRQFGAPAYALRQPHTNWLNPDRRLRVGYVSGDFNFHSAAIAWASVVAQHSPRIEACLYSTLEPSRYDARTARWQARFGKHFVDVSAMSAHELALTIQQDQVDILVDLSGYTNNNRLLTLAYRPAPIQIQAWGYVLGTQSPMLDVIFADDIVASPAIRAQLAERVVDLPSLLTYLPPMGPDALPEATPLPCLSQPPVFAVFQRGMKVTPPAIAAWRRILEALPEARMFFKGGDYSPTTRSRIADAFGPAASRITFDFHTGHHEHMLWYQDVDLSLDSWPQTGGVSTLESLWMHVPTLTLLGERMIQRASASFMARVGFDRCVTQSVDEYVAQAIALVTTDRDALAEMRATARARMQASPIMTGYVEAVETAYRSLWREHCLRETVTAPTVQ